MLKRKALTGVRQGERKNSAGKSASAITPKVFPVSLSSQWPAGYNHSSNRRSDAQSQRFVAECASKSVEIFRVNEAKSTSHGRDSVAAISILGRRDLDQAMKWVEPQSKWTQSV